MIPRKTAERPPRLTPSGPTDFELVESIRTGDRDAFGQLYKRHFPAVLQACHRRLWFDGELAGDVAQETFLRLLVALPNLRDPARIRHWLIVTAKNRCRDHYRRGTRRHEHGLEPGSFESARDPGTTEDLSSTIADRAWIEAILEGTGGSLAIVLREFYLHDLSLATIEVRHGWATGTGKVLLHRARQRAKAFADAHPLHTILPFPFVRFLRKATARAPQTEMAMAAALIAPLLIVGAIVGPSLPSATPRESGSRGAESRAAEPANETHRELTPPPAGLQQDTAAASSPAERASQTTANTHPSLLDFEPIALPGTGREIRSHEPVGQEPRYEIGVDAGEVGGVPANAAVVNYDDPEETDPAYEAACRTAEAAEDPAYCRRG